MYVCLCVFEFLKFAFSKILTAFLKIGFSFSFINVASGSMKKYFVSIIFPDSKIHCNSAKIQPVKKT